MRLVSLVFNELEDIVALSIAIGEKAVNRILLIREYFEHRIQFRERQQLHVGARYLEQNYFAPNSSEVAMVDGQRADADAVNFFEPAAIHNHVDLARSNARVNCCAEDDISGPHRELAH